MVGVAAIVPHADDKVCRYGPAISEEAVLLFTDLQNFKGKAYEG